VEGGGLDCPHPTETDQIQEMAPAIAEIRRTQFPPKPITPQAEIARLRRREKKIMFGQIRAQKSEQKKERAIEREQMATSKRTITIQIWIRQKWIEVPYTEVMAWSKYRRYLERKFNLKQWRWSFEETIANGGWCHKLPNPFTVDPEKRYRIVLYTRETDTKDPPRKTDSKHDTRPTSETEGDRTPEARKPVHLVHSAGREASLECLCRYSATAAEAGAGIKTGIDETEFSADRKAHGGRFCLESSEDGQYRVSSGV
jgi:hypothetical protein